MADGRTAIPAVGTCSVVLLFTLARHMGIANSKYDSAILEDGSMRTINTNIHYHFTHAWNDIVISSINMSSQH